MVRRTLPLLLVLAVAGAPIAAEVCQITCASPVEHAGTLHSALQHATDESGHPCHDAVATGGTQIAPMPHACGHDREGRTPAASISVGGTLIWTIAIPLALVSITPAASTDPSPPTVTSSPLSRRLTGPASVRSAMPLRI